MLHGYARRLREMDRFEPYLRRTLARTIFYPLRSFDQTMGCGPAGLRELLKRSGIGGLLLWIWPLLTFLVGRRRDLAEYAVLDLAAFVQVGFLCICVICLFASYLLRRQAPFRLLLSAPLKWLLYYAVLCGLSTAWSSYPLYTAYRAFECLVFLFLIEHVIADSLGAAEDVVEWIVSWTLWAGILSTVRPWVHGYVDLSSASLMDLHGGGSYIIGTMIPLALFVSRRRLLAILMLLVCLVSTSTKVNVGLIMVACAAGFTSRRVLVRGLVGLIALGLLFLMLISPARHVLADVFFYGKTPERIATGTGRIVLWMELLDDLDTPSVLYGSGFSIAERVSADQGSTRAPLAHNAMLAALVGTGITGFVLILLFLVHLSWYGARQRRRPTWKVGLVTTSIMVTWMSMTSTGVGSRLDPAWVSVAMYAALVSLLRDRNQSISFSGRSLQNQRGHRPAIMRSEG